MWQSRQLTYLWRACLESLATAAWHNAHAAIERASSLPPLCGSWQSVHDSPLHELAARSGPSRELRRDVPSASFGDGPEWQDEQIVLTMLASRRSSPNGRRAGAPGSGVAPRGTKSIGPPAAWLLPPR